MKKIKIKKVKIENENGAGYFFVEKINQIIDYYKLEPFRSEIAGLHSCKLNRVIFEYDFLN